LLETPGNCLDHYTVEEEIRKAFDEYNLVALGFDPANADAIANPLTNEGYPIVKVLQTFGGMSPGCTGLIADIGANKMHHCNNRVLSWCMSNVSSADRGDEMRFVKDANANKIDGAVAAAIAVGRARASVRETQPAIFF